MRVRTQADGPAQGSIAILALWGIALIAMLIAPVAFATRGEVTIARNALAESRAQLAAEAGTQLGLQRLLRRHNAGTREFDGTPETWAQGSTRITITIADESGKIDLNVAPLELFAGLFVAVGEPREAAKLIACNVLDRRGDTGADCPQEGVAHAARRFAVPEELAEVPGIGSPLYDRVAPYVTVATGAAAIDPRIASRTVLLAIPGATPDLVDSFLESRKNWGDLGAADATMLGAATPYVMMSPSRDFTISATALTSDGARYCAELQVRLTESATQPYQVIAWRTPSPDRGMPAPTKLARVP
jgi:general secretion pathway protein K